MSDLKPYPHCGSTAIYETYHEERFGYKVPVIFCNWCKAWLAVEDDGPYKDLEKDFAYRRAKTIEAWNRRAGEQHD